MLVGATKQVSYDRFNWLATLIRTIGSFFEPSRVFRVKQKHFSESLSQPLKSTSSFKPAQYRTKLNCLPERAECLLSQIFDYNLCVKKTRCCCKRGSEYCGMGEKMFFWMRLYARLDDLICNLLKKCENGMNGRNQVWEREREEREGDSNEMGVRERGCVHVCARVHVCID